jgi:hypothetical protein
MLPTGEVLETLKEQNELLAAICSTINAYAIATLTPAQKEVYKRVLKQSDLDVLDDDITAGKDKQ